MCSATTIPFLTGILGVGSSIAQQKAQSEATYAQQMAEYNRQRAEVEIMKRKTDDDARVRNAQALLNYQQIQFAEQEANAAATQEKTEAAREIQRAQSVAKLGALEANAFGLTSNRMGVDMGYTLGQKFGSIETTRVSKIDQLQAEKEGTKLSAYTQPYRYTEPVAPTKGSVNYFAAATSGLTGYMGSGGTFNFLSGLGSCKPKTTTSCNPCGTTSRFK